MSWLAQVRHIVAKDIREARWFVLVFVVIVVIATLRASGWDGPGLATFASLVLLASALLVAAAVQADSPTRIDALWISHPFRPTAVLAAKLAIMCAVVAVGALGQLIALMSFDVRGANLGILVLGSLPAFILQLLAAGVAASVLRDLRSFALAVVAIPVSLFVLALLVGSSVGGAAWSTILGSPAGGIMATVLGVAMLAWLYRTRDARRRGMIPGLAVAAVLFLSGSVWRFDASHGADAAAADPVALVFEQGDARVRSSSYELHFAVRAPDLPWDTKLVLLDARITLRLSDGSTLHVAPGVPHQEVDVFRPVITRDTDARWLGLSEHRPASTSIGVELTREQRSAVSRGVTSAVLEGRVAVLEARTLLTMPLTTGSVERGDGYRIRLLDWSAESEEPFVRVETKLVSMPDRPLPPSPWLWGTAVELALINDARREAMPMYDAGGSGSGSGLVLPGAHVRGWTTEYHLGARLHPRTRERSAPDDAWLRDARLLVMVQEVRGTFPVRLETAMR